MGTPWRERKVRGSELPVSSGSSRARWRPHLQAGGGAGGRGAILLACENRSGCIAAKGTRGGPGRERAGEGIPRFYLVLALVRAGTRLPENTEQLS